MIKRLWNKISGLLKGGREYCLVIEQLDNRLELTYAKIFQQKKKINILKRKKIKDFSKLKKPLFFLDKLILALDSHNSTTIESVVRLKRSRPQELINEAELDHLVFRGFWEFLNHYRGWAAKKMSIADLDLVLANIEIRDVGLGSHRVFNPIGFKGTDFFLRFRGTFIPKTILDSVSQLKNWAANFAIVESHGIVSASIPEPSDFVVHLAENRTTVFSLKDEEKLYCKECLWGSVNVIKAIGRVFAVDDEVAHLILDRYALGKVSSKVRRIIESQINQQFRVLLEMLDSIYNKSGVIARPAVHFNFRFAMPPPETVLNNRNLRLVNFVRWLEMQGFTIKFDSSGTFSPKIHQSTLGLLTHSYFDSHYSVLNRLLHRRAKWLVSQN